MLLGDTDLFTLLQLTILHEQNVFLNVLEMFNLFFQVC